MMRTTSIRRVPSLAIALLLAACAAADPSPSVPAPVGSAVPTSVAAAPTGAPTPTVAPTPSPPPRPAGTLLIWQLDGIDTATTKTESLYRLDIATGATTPIAQIPVTELTCCPTSITFSRDMATAFMYGVNYRGTLDMASGTFAKASGRIPPGTVAVSPTGDRLAWVDNITGTSESIIVAGRDGKQIQRVALPTGAFASIPAWTTDDGTLLVTTELPVKTASDVRLASTIACCSIDRGVQATHLLVVPLDGSSIRDIYDDSAEVIADQAQPIPTQPPGPRGWALGAIHTIQFWPGPDLRTVFLVVEACPAQWKPRDAQATCTDELLSIDTESGKRTPLPVPWTRTSSVGWSPDGRRLSLLGSDGGGPTGLYVMDRDGGHLVDLGPADALLAWSPDGKWITYWRYDMSVNGFRPQVWVTSSTGGDPRFLAAHATAGWLEP